MRAHMRSSNASSAGSALSSQGASSCAPSRLLARHRRTAPSAQGPAGAYASAAAASTSARRGPTARAPDANSATGLARRPTNGT